MDVISSIFLRAKHWQIFMFFLAVGIGIPILALLLPAFQSYADSEHADPASEVATVICMVFVIGWFWAMGSFLNSQTPVAVRLPQRFFIFSTFYPVPYMTVFMVLISFDPSSFLFIVPFHLLATFCMFYLLYFVARALVQFESGKRATFYDYAGPFFLLWFFPIGVWIIQPRINRIYASSLRAPSAA